MKKALKKLNLNKTTISSLNAQQLNQVEGGTDSESIRVATCWQGCNNTVVWDLGGGTMDTCGNTCTCPMPTTPTNTIQVPQTV